jgi:hypothetical protein
LGKILANLGHFFSNENATLFPEFYRIEIIIFRSKFGEISPTKKNHCPGARVYRLHACSVEILSLGSCRVLCLPNVMTHFLSLSLLHL